MQICFASVNGKGNAKSCFVSVVRSDRSALGGLTGGAGQARSQDFPENDFFWKMAKRSDRRVSGGLTGLAGLTGHQLAVRPVDLQRLYF